MEKVLKTEKFPADLLLLHASAPTEVCIETSCFDKDSSLRHWQCVPSRIVEHEDARDHSAFLDALGTGNTKITDVLRDAEISFHVAASRLPAEWERSVNFLCARGWSGQCLFITDGMGGFNGMSESGEA